MDEPSASDPVAILAKLAPKYEEHHHVRYTQAARVAGASLSARYIPDRFLPDTAIDLLDEAGARARIARNKAPAPVREAEARAAWNAELDARPVVIDGPQIADIVSVTSGVPVSSLSEVECRRMLACDFAMKSGIILQAEAVAALGKAFRRSSSPL